MDPSPVRVIAFCSCILGAFFLARSVSVKTPKYMLHELLAFKVNKSRFFRRYVNQKLEATMGFVFLFLGFAVLIYLEIDALGQQPGSTTQPRVEWWKVMGWTMVALVAIAYALNRVARFFSGKIFVEHVRFMVETHGYPLEADHPLVFELGHIMRIPLDEEDTVESYCAKVRTKMKVAGSEKRGPIR